MHTTSGISDAGGAVVGGAMVGATVVGGAGLGAAAFVVLVPGSVVVTAALSALSVFTCFSRSSIFFCEPSPPDWPQPPMNAHASKHNMIFRTVPPFRCRTLLAQRRDFTGQPSTKGRPRI